MAVLCSDHFLLESLKVDTLTINLVHSWNIPFAGELETGGFQIL